MKRPRPSPEVYALFDALEELEGQILDEILDKVTQRGEEVLKRLLDDASRPTSPKILVRSASAAMDAAR